MMGHGASLMVSLTQLQSTSRDTVWRRKMSFICNVWSPLIMIVFGTHQILSFQLFKAIQHACNAGKWYNGNYTTGNLHRYKGREARSVIREALNRSWKLGPPVICFSHVKICDFFFFLLPFPSPFAFLSSALFFLCPVNCWLLLMAQPLSLKQLVLLLKSFLTLEPPLVDWLSGKTVLALKNRVLILHRERTKGIRSVSWSCFIRVEVWQANSCCHCSQTMN